MEGLWMPKLVEVKQYAETDPYWAEFGFETLNVPADCPIVASRMNALADRFNEKYMFRMVGAETMEVWQVYLQNIFDGGVHTLEHRLSIYQQNADLMAKVNGYSHKSTVKVTGSTTGKSVAHSETNDNGDIQTQRSDTPDSGVNLDGTYAAEVAKEVSKDKSTGDATNNTEGTDNKDTVVSDESMDNTKNMDAINKMAMDWMDFECQFIDTFEVAFMSVFEY